jgi:hypothetical protein
VNGTLFITQCKTGKPYYYLLRKTKKQGALKPTEYTQPVEVTNEWIWAACDYGEPFGMKHNIHVQPRIRSDIVRRCQQKLARNNFQPEEPPYDVVILMFDATSRAHFHRVMRKTLEFITNATMIPDAEVERRKEKKISNFFSFFFPFSHLLSNSLVLQLFDFPHFSVVGENSPPNQKAMMYADAKKEGHVFTLFSNLGYATMNAVAYCRARCPVRDVDHALLDAFFCQWGSDVSELYHDVSEKKKEKKPQQQEHFLFLQFDSNSFFLCSSSQGTNACMGYLHAHQVMISYLKQFMNGYAQHKIPIISWVVWNQCFFSFAFPLFSFL